ncbi:MAG: T9SS type A sorting domain-containing protein [Chitinophagales bacterium]
MKRSAPFYSLIILVWLICSMPIFSFSQAGELDPGFGTGGIVITDFGQEQDDYAYSVLVQPDGKIIIAGWSYTTFENDFAVARYNSDGTLDVDFGIGGLATFDFEGEEDYGYSALLQSDGKIVIAGTKCCSDDFGIIRLNTDGTLDNSFSGDGKAEADFFGSSDDGLSIAIQPDNKIIIGGEAYDSDRLFGLMRFNTDGTLDNSFGTGGKVTTSVGPVADFLKSIAIQSDGKIVAGGYYDTDGTDYHDYALVRYNTDGTLDNGFGTGGIVTMDLYHDQDYGFSVAVDADNNILLAGYSENVDGRNFIVLRFTGDGILDNTFGTDGIGSADFGSGEDHCKALAIQPDGKIILAGLTAIPTPDYAVVVARFNTDGILDTSFGSGGMVTTDIADDADYGYAAAIQPDTKILVAGYSYQETTAYDFMLIRYLGDQEVAINENINSNELIHINPVPFNDQFAVSCQNGASGSGELIIFNLAGQKILSQRITSTETIIDGSEYPDGMYFIRYSEGEFMQNVKIIKN